MKSKRVILKYATTTTTYNHSQPSTCTHSLSKLSSTIYNHLQSPTIIQFSIQYFLGIYQNLELYFFSVIQSLIRWQAVDCIPATVLKGNSTAYIFLIILQKFSAQLFQITLIKSSTAQFRRALGSRLQSCVILKRDSTWDNFLKFLQVNLSPQVCGEFLF